MRRSTRARFKMVAQAILFVAICQLVGAIGAWTMAMGDPGWYDALRKPVFTPPGWLFGPVWTTLYTLMGIAGFLVWRRGRRRWGIKSALTLFALQLLLNAAWTPVFFGAQAIAAGAAVIVALWVVLAATVWRFFLVHRTAAWLLVPYLVWVTFAAVLNLSIWVLNTP